MWGKQTSMLQGPWKNWVKIIVLFLFHLYCLFACESQLLPPFTKNSRGQDFICQPQRLTDYTLHCRVCLCYVSVKILSHPGYNYPRRVELRAVWLGWRYLKMFQGGWESKRLQVSSTTSPFLHRFKLPWNCPMWEYVGASVCFQLWVCEPLFCIFCVWIWLYFCQGWRSRPRSQYDM